MRWLSTLFKRASQKIPHLTPVHVSEELDLAVMHTVRSSGHYCSGVAVEIGSVDQTIVNTERIRLQHLRNWLTTQTDPALIQAYDGWISFYENGVQEAQHAIDTGARQRWQQGSDKRRTAYMDLIHRADKLNIPAPPTRP